MKNKVAETPSVKFYAELLEQSQSALKHGTAVNPLKVTVESESQNSFVSRIKIRNLK